jgi:hypothetical protein
VEEQKAPYVKRPLMMQIRSWPADDAREAAVDADDDLVVVDLVLLGHSERMNP